jgi:hypothetical protein
MEEIDAYLAAVPSRELLRDLAHAPFYLFCLEEDGPYIRVLVGMEEVVFLCPAGERDDGGWPGEDGLSFVRKLATVGLSGGIWQRPSACLLKKIVLSGVRLAHPRDLELCRGGLRIR